MNCNHADWETYDPVIFVLWEEIPIAPLLFRHRYRVSSARLPGWDYRWPGAYAVTICVKERVCCLGEVAEAEVTLSTIGAIVVEEWLAIPRSQPHVVLDEWVIMPDHLHGILIFQSEEFQVPKEGGTAGSLGAVVGQFKQRSTKRIRARQPGFAWQERFFDQILRTTDGLDRYRAYIRDNPLRWQLSDSAVTP